MATYPISLNAKPYRGKNPKLMNEFRRELESAARIEDHINTVMEKLESHVFTYSQISIETGVNRDIVRKLLFALDGGHNGITVFNLKMSKNE